MDTTQSTLTEAEVGTLETFKGGCQQSVRSRVLEVLVADDSEVSRLFAARSIARLGWRCDTVANGCEAVAAIERVAYDAVLLDSHMPGMDGLDAARVIRERGIGGRNLLIVGMSGSDGPEERQACLSAGMDEFLGKPFTPDALVALIESLLARGNEGQGRRGPATAAAEKPSKVVEETEDQLEAVRRQLRRISRDDEAFGRRMLNTFVREGSGRVSEMTNAAFDADLERVYRAAHAMKGLCASFGASVLAALAQAVEESVLAGRGSDAREYASLLSADWRRLLQSLAYQAA
jgi:CheY-like chemotaxis protein/HPt (histidine-containing phosphotransfer) domain-containing protein